MATLFNVQKVIAVLNSTMLTLLLYALCCDTGGSPSSLPVSGSKIKYNFRIDNNGGTSLDTQGAISIDVVDAANQSIAPDAVVCTVGSPATSIAVNVGRVFTNPTGRAFGTSTEEVATCSFTVTVSAAQAQAGVMPQYNVKVALKVQGGVDSAALDSAVPLDAAFAAVKVYSGSVITVTYAVSTSSLTNGDYVTGKKLGQKRIATAATSFRWNLVHRYETFSIQCQLGSMEYPLQKRLAMTLTEF